MSIRAYTLLLSTTEEQNHTTDRTCKQEVVQNSERSIAHRSRFSLFASRSASEDSLDIDTVEGNLATRSFNMRTFSSRLLARALLLIVLSATAAITLAQNPKTSTESGTISGIHENGLSIYKGVPFAAPPVGDLR